MKNYMENLENIKEETNKLIEGNIEKYQDDLDGIHEKIVLLIEKTSELQKYFIEVSDEAGIKNTTCILTLLKKYLASDGTSSLEAEIDALTSAQ